MTGLKTCPNCSAENLEKARYCHNCGSSLTRLKGRIGALKQKIEYRTREKLENIRNRLDSQINNYLLRLDKPEEFKIGSVSVPETKRDDVRNALLSFQEKIGGSLHVETSEEFQQWLKDLPNMLDQQKCLVCFVNWKINDEIVVCKHCQSGGHRDHLENWVVSRNLCPLCRKSISRSDLILVELGGKID